MIGDTFGLRKAWIEARQETRKAIEDAYRAGREYAQAEYDYQVAKAKAATEMRASGEPSTYISTVIKGHEGVREPLLRRNNADSDFKVSTKAIDFYRDDARQLYDEYRRSMQGDPNF